MQQLTLGPIKAFTSFYYRAPWLSLVMADFFTSKFPIFLFHLQVGAGD